LRNNLSLNNTINFIVELIIIIGNKIITKNKMGNQVVVEPEKPVRGNLFYLN